MEKYFYENGDYYIVGQKHDLRHGKGTLYYINRAVQFEGRFINDNSVQSNSNKRFITLSQNLENHYFQLNNMPQRNIKTINNNSNGDFIYLNNINNNRYGNNNIINNIYH